MLQIIRQLLGFLEDPPNLQDHNTAKNPISQDRNRYTEQNPTITPILQGPSVIPGQNTAELPILQDHNGYLGQNLGLYAAYHRMFNPQMYHPGPTDMPMQIPTGYPSHFHPGYMPIMSLPGSQYPNHPLFAPNFPLPPINPKGLTAPAAAPVGAAEEMKKEAERKLVVEPKSELVDDKKNVAIPSPGEDGTVSLDWPDGDQHRECLANQKQRKWKQTKWVWRSTGYLEYKGHPDAEMRLCQGVLSCTNPNCGRLVRPKTVTTTRDKQIEGGCKLCQSPLFQSKCKARTYHYEFTKDDRLYNGWDHEGYHEHQRPPGGHLSASKEKAVDQQVIRNPNASAHALRTGNTTPGSVPFPEISPSLANPQAARYQLSQSQGRLGISTPASAKGGLSVLRSLYDLSSELTDPFIIDSSIHGPAFIMFQTPFMKAILIDSVNSWNNDAKGVSAGRHGFVTDGDHSFFRDGVLNMTCVFNSVTASWIPVLYTWILRQDIAHHRPHFRHISQSVVEHVRLQDIPFEKKYLLHVFDFSAAQRSAHAEEYAEALISMVPGYSNLTKASQALERDSFLKQALEVERGCSFHFWESAERIKSNGALVPNPQAYEFNRFLRILVDEGTTRKEFDETIGLLYTNFPRIHNWLSWWLRPTYRSMIFPAYSSLDPDIAFEVPKTSNPAEHSHSLLHNAVGTDQDLIPGIRKLFLHVKQLESQFKSIKDGHYDPAPPRSYRSPSKKIFDINDGRAPDTEQALNPRGIFDYDPLTVNKNTLLSYKWQSPNSCFVDVGLEIWFRSFCAWPKETKTAFLTSIPSNTFLSCLFYHYDRRFKQLSMTTTVFNLRRNLELMQTMALNHVFDKWKLYSDRTEYGCAKTWLAHAVRDGNPSAELQGYFAVTHEIHRKCENGHPSSMTSTKPPNVWFTINNTDMDIASSFFGAHVTTTNYFQHHIPRSQGGNFAGGTTPIHLLPPEVCTHQSCTAQSTVSSVVTYWPQIFNINADGLRIDSNSEGLRFENSFSITDKDGSTVTYDFVGRVRHINGNHFISEVRFGGQCYVYNDMANGGELIPSDNPLLLEIKDDLESVCYIYNRTSLKSKISRSVTDIEVDYARQSNSSTKPTHFVDLSSPAPAHIPSLAEPIDSQFGPPDIMDSEDTASRTFEPITTKDISLPVLDTYPTLTFTLCTHCRLSKGDTSRQTLTVLCTLCKATWHDDCLSNSAGKDTGMDDTWVCPACVNPHGGLWDQTMIGDYILLQPTSASRFYPAKVLGRSSTQEVHIEWYTGNVYDSNNTSSTARSVFTPLECLQAKFRDPFFAYTKENMGTIKWSIRLEEDAADAHGYKNTHLRKVLEDTYGAVLEIILGEREHPVVDLYNDWIKNRPRSTKMADHHKFNFAMQFSPRILLGDASLLEPFLLYLRHDVKNSKVFVESHWIDNVASLLFRLVILRTYLGRQSCDDMQIFYLAYTGSKFDDIAPDDIYAEAKRGSIVRVLTLAEKAMAASGSMRTLGIQFSLQHQVDKGDLLAHTKLSEALSQEGNPYDFFHTTASGLIGNRKFLPNRRLEPDLFETKIIPNRERPKPRPRGKAAQMAIPDGVRIIKQANEADEPKRGMSIEEWVKNGGSRRSKRLRTV